MEGKWGRGMPRIMMLNDIKANESWSSVYQCIENVGETVCLEPAFRIPMMMK